MILAGTEVDDVMLHVSMFRIIVGVKFLRPTLAEHAKEINKRRGGREIGMFSLGLPKILFPTVIMAMDICNVT